MGFTHIFSHVESPQMGTQLKQHFWKNIMGVSIVMGVSKMVGFFQGKIMENPSINGDPNSWICFFYNGTSQSKMDENWTYPYDSGNP